MNKDPMNEWVLRNEILAALHRWPVIVVFSLAGAMVAMVATFFWPSPYRANVEISVELNPYRILDDQYLPAFTNAEFRNIDDYKHWQMLQLSIVVLSDPYLSETLNRLREIDPYWDSIDQQDLRQMLEAEWRNAGLWLLSANADTQARAADAVETWREVILNLTQDTIASSQDLFSLELTLRSLNDQLVENQLHTAVLEDSLLILGDYANEFYAQEQDALTSNQVHQELFAIATQLAELLPGDQQVIINFPEQDSLAGDYLTWIEQTIPQVKDQIRSLQMENDLLIEEISNVSSQWEASLQEAQGLAATLRLENRLNTQPEVRQIRSYGLAALIGSMVGLLLWIVVFLVQVTRKEYQ
ncbi:MAG: hypothetical protein WBD62_16790 [Anaerolineales bacterium]